MISRRDMIFGTGCLVAAGSAAALKPRNHVSLGKGIKLADVIPHSFGGWTEQPTDALVVPQTDGSLSAKLYSQIVGRLYQNGAGEQVMVLIAYGDTQNDLLQLHRPEVCYPAFGFQITSNKAESIALDKGVALPGRALTATTAMRLEQILYWTRIGEYLPESGREQRLAKLRCQIAGVIPDGVLVRLSNAQDDAQAALALNERFARALMQAVPPNARAALVGTGAATRLNRA